MQIMIKYTDIHTVDYLSKLKCITVQSFTQIININKIMIYKPVKVDPLMSHMCNMNEVNTIGWNILIA